MPRQNHREHEGDIREYEILVGDGKDWRKVHEGSLVSSFEPQQVAFGKVVSAERLKLVAKSGFGGDGAAALAEWAVHYCGPPLVREAPADIEYRRARSASPDVDEGDQ
jgi:hypothetical protein